MKRKYDYTNTIHGFPIDFLDKAMSHFGSHPEHGWAVHSGGEEWLLTKRLLSLPRKERREIEKQYTNASVPFANRLDEAIALVDAKYKNLAKRADEHGPRDMFDAENQKLMEVRTIHGRLLEGKRRIEEAERISPEQGKRVTSAVKLDLLANLAIAKTGYGTSHLNTPMARLVDGVLSLVTSGRTRMKTETSNVMEKAEALIARPHR